LMLSREAFIQLKYRRGKEYLTSATFIYMRGTVIPNKVGGWVYSGGPGIEGGWGPLGPSGRYYLKVKSLGEFLGTYQIRMTSDVTCPPGDIANADWVGVRDCKVDFYDLAVLISHWLDSCSEPYWCDDSDFDESQLVNLVDFAVLADNWLEGATP